MWKLWLIISGIFFILEIYTVGFLVFWFGVGALLTLIASLFIPSITIQTTIFIITSILLLFATRPFVDKFAKPDANLKSNAFSIQGKTGKVIQSIDPIEGSRSN